MATALILRSSDDESVFDNLVETLSLDPLPSIREISIQESSEHPFTPSLLERCRALALRRELVLTTATLVSVSCHTDYGLRALWYLLPLFMDNATEIHLELGKYITFSLLVSFFRMFAGQLGGQTRFARVRSLRVDIKLHRFEEGQRLSVSSAILEAFSAPRTLQALTLPIDVLAVNWHSCFEVLHSLTELEELSFYPGKLTIPPFINVHIGTPRSGLRLLKELSIHAPLALCANVVHCIGCPLSKIRIECGEVITASVMAEAFQKIQSSCLQSQARTSQSLALLSPILASPSAIDSMFSLRGLPTIQWISSLTHLDIALTGVGANQVKLEALYPFCLMKTCTISCPLPLNYDGDQLGSLLSCWPRIESLSLNPRPSHGLDIGVVPSALVLRDVARCGHHLREFRACLDGFDICKSTEMGDTPSWDSLRVLDLGYSLGPKDLDGIDMALCLIAKLFPSLEAIGGMPHEPVADEWPTELERAFRRRMYYS